MKALKNLNKRFPCKCKIVSLDLLSIFLKYKDKKNDIFPLLSDIKNKFGCITEEDLVCITEHLDIPENKIRKIIELHNEFEIVPVKQHVIRVCGGMVCQLCGSDKILETACDELEIIPGSTTEDSKFKLEVVECVGLCEISPIIAIDNTFYGKIDESDAQALIAHEKQKVNQNP
ncbi:MAG TPA: hypothetical protein DDW90_01880 [Cyanobacteria bacterium UBA9971]|nr:hypothetical protein [Cyanobacteria bacterium UBA9971]